MTYFQVKHLKTKVKTHVKSRIVTNSKSNSYKVPKEKVLNRTSKGR